jgi:phenylpyruvate C(3)-methyltransferase
VSTDPTTLSAREAFNGAVTSSAICAAFELGLLQELEANNSVDLTRFASERGTSLRSIESVCKVLAHAGVVEWQDSPMATGPAPGPAFADTWANKGYFLWLVGGYGRMLSSAARLCKDAMAGVATGMRDGASIARAGMDYGAQFVDPFFDEVLDGRDFANVADLGCGSARRLIRLAASRPGGRYLGIELDAGAVDVARQAVRQAELEDRIEIVHADIAWLDPDRFPGFDLVFSFFLGHDLWPRENCVQALNRIRRAFPDARALLLGDTYRSDRLTQADTPIFTLGFEYTHALMGQYIPSVQEWRSTFAESDWTLLDVHELEIPYSAIFELWPRY